MSLTAWIRSVGIALTKAATASPVQPHAAQAPSSEAAGKQVEAIKDEGAQAATLQQFITDHVSLSSRPHHAENLTIQFLIDHLPHSSPFRPKTGEWLRNWDLRPRMPADIKDLRNLAHSAIRSRLDDLQKQEADRATEEGQRKAAEILARNGPRIDKFLDIAYRKVTTPDEYGDENPKALDQEIRRLIKKLSETERDLPDVLWPDDSKRPLIEAFLGSVARPIVRDLRIKFDDYYRSRKDRLDSLAVDKMTGIDFELYVAELLRSIGVEDVSTTPVTGDQGADLLFTWNGDKYAVQAKRYLGSVGNRAIQEAHAAKDYYGCHTAWVVSNSHFTPSAKALAKELQVVLVDGDLLRDFRSFAARALGPRLGP